MMRRVCATALRTQTRRVATAAAAATTKPLQPLPTTSAPNPFTLLAPEMTHVRETLVTLLGASHPALTEVATYYFTLPGKQLRPLLVLLFANATNGHASAYDVMRHAPQNATHPALRSELDLALSSPTILDEWNARMPDHTASFASPFSIPPFSSSSPYLSSSSSIPNLSRAPPENSSILPTQLRLAQITEMIHVASLLHDDVLDRAATRRAAPSAPFAFGNKLSVLGGDFLLGRASAALSRLGDLQVVELMSTVVANLVEGEVMQMRSATSGASDVSDVGVPTLGQEVWTTYLRKSYLKTASLMAKSARSSVVLGGAHSGSEADESLKDVAYAYGRNIGIAFQLVDDALDFSSSSDLGKPGFGADLKLGLATAPTLYAWEEHPQMGALVSRRFKGEGDVEIARDLVLRSSALDRTRALAREYSDKALEALERLPPTDAKEALIALANKVVDRVR